MTNITIDMLENLLVENSELKLKQHKWFTKVLSGDISIDEVLYRLRVTSNKRVNIYKNFNGDNIFTSTRPYNYNEITNK